MLSSTSSGRLSTIGLCVAMVSSAALAGPSLTGRDAAPDLNLLRVALALALCLIIGVAAIFWLKRKMPGRLLPGLSPSVRVVETARLGIRASLYVVEFDRRRFLLAADTNGIVSIAESKHERTASDDPMSAAS